MGKETLTTKGQGGSDTKVTREAVTARWQGGSDSKRVERDSDSKIVAPFHYATQTQDNEKITGGDGT